jgi:phosphoribosylanthranilate isomerase
MVERGFDVSLPNTVSASTAPRRTRIKICGVSTASDVQACVDAGADAVGFVLYEGSVRHVRLDQAVTLARGLPPSTVPVLLFVNPAPEQVRSAVAALPHAVLQFHGDEPPEFCIQWQRPYLRAVAMQAGIDLLDFDQRFHHACALIVDAPAVGHGGGGKVFDWTLLAPFVRADRAATRLVLSGGLDAANVIDGVLRLRPFAVDVSSGVERTRGVKDPQRIHAFCESVRRADKQLAAV